MNRINGFIVTNHARQRMYQRGINCGDVELVLSYGRRIMESDNKCLFIWKVPMAKSAGYVPKPDWNRLQALNNVCVVCKLDDKLILTVFRREQD